MSESAGRIGIIGLGDFGLFCMEAFEAADDLSVVAVADPRPDLEQRVRHVSRLRTYSDWRELLSDPLVEVVHVATPPWTHADMAVAAAQARKSVFVEKPLALSLTDADAMIAEFASRSLTLGIDYVMRHSSIYRLLIEVSRRGLLGNLRRHTLNNAAQLVPKDHWFWDRSKSGGILVEHGVHFFDVVRQIAGEARARHTVDAGNRILAEVEYAFGLGAFYHDFSFDPRVEHLGADFIFDAGSAQVSGWIPERLELRAVSGAREQEWRSAAELFPSARTSVYGGVVSISLSVNDRQRAYRDAVVTGIRQVVATHRDPSVRMDVSVEDARASLALALEAQQLAPIPT